MRKFMRLDFNDYLDKNQLEEKIRYLVYEETKKHRGLSSEMRLYRTCQLFLQNLKDVADELYTAILHKKDQLGPSFKFKPSHLDECITDVTLSLLPIFMDIISNIGCGGMFQDQNNLSEEKAGFKAKAEMLSKDLGKMYKAKYIDLLKKQKYQYYGNWYKGLKVIAFIISAVVGIIKKFPL